MSGITAQMRQAMSGLVVKILKNNPPLTLLNLSGAEFDGEGVYLISDTLATGNITSLTNIYL